MPSNNNYDPDAVADYIVQSAQARGIDPSVALSVARSEGLRSYVGDQGTSFGPFQLHYGNMVKGANSVGGLGDEFTKATGKHASDPSTVRDQIDFALDNAAKNGWGAFHGAANSGIGPFDGISNKSKALGNYSSSGNQSAQDDPDGEALLQSLIKQVAPQQKPVSPSEAKVSIKEAVAPNPQFPDEAPPLTVKRSPQVVQEQDPEGEALLKSLIGSPTQAPVNPDIAPQIKAPVSANNVVRSVGTGIPIVGGLLNKADAATNALLAPVLNPLFDKKDQLQGDTWQDRYQNALNIQNGMDQSYAEQHPIANTAGNITGAVAGTIPAMMAAPTAFGLGDGILLGRAALSGGTSATLNSADYIARNGVPADLNDLRTPAATGLAFGLLGPAAGDVIGSGVNALSNLVSRTTPAARSAADGLGDMTPVMLREELNRLGPDAMVADAAPALRAKAEALGASGGQPTNIVERAMQLRAGSVDDTMHKLMNKQLGPAPDAEATLNKIQENAQKEASPHYEAGKFGPPMDVTPVLAKIDAQLPNASGGIKSILEAAKKALINEPSTKGAPAGLIVPKSDPEGVLGARQALDDMMYNKDSGEARLGPNAMRVAGNIRNDLDQIVKSNEDFARGDAIYAQAQSAKRAFQEGQKIFTTNTRPDDLARRIAKMPPQDVDALRAGARASIEDSAEASTRGEGPAIQGKFARATNNRANLNQLFPNGQDALDAIHAEATKRATERGVLANSLTAKKQAAMQEFKAQPNNALNDTPTIVGGILGGAPGAIASKLGASAWGQAKNAMTLNSLNNLKLGLAKGLTALPGPEQEEFLKQIERAYRTNNASNALSKGAAKAANVIIRSAGPYGWNALMPQRQTQ